VAEKRDEVRVTTGFYYSLKSLLDCFVYLVIRSFCLPILVLQNGGFALCEKPKRSFLLQNANPVLLYLP
jgi:hypothetical protein